MPDQNDILYEAYTADFFELIRRIILGGGGAGNGSGTGSDIVTTAQASVEGARALFARILDVVMTMWDIFVVLSWLASGLFIFGIIYAYIRHEQVGEIEMERLKHQEHLYQELYGGANSNSRWDDVAQHIESERPNDWKLAIIEADVMLEEALTNAGFAGLSIGEKLKSASPNQLKSLDLAWRAHRVRNQIAHEGSDFVLTKKVGLETITQYKIVFEELGVL